MIDLLSLKTPCYIINENKFKNNVEFVRKSFCFHLGDDEPILGYSVKTNSSPDLLKMAKELGMYAEVVSDDEYKTALLCGYSKDRIIFNGPQKSKAMLLYALKNRSIVNLDNFKEIKVISENIAELYKIPLRVGIRVNFDLERCCEGETTAGTEVSRFGFCVENGDFEKAVIMLREMELSVSGLHMHYSSRTRSTKIFHELSWKARELIIRHNLEDMITFIDIGGGFFLGKEKHTDGKPDIDDYAKVICSSLKGILNLGDVKLVIEPGASVISSAVDYMSKVINQRDIRGTKVLTLDGSILHINPFMIHRSTEMEFIYKDASRRRLKEQIVCGSTCMENDRLVKINDGKELKTGDYIYCYCTGAYTMGFNNSFINCPPYVYKKAGKTYELIRDKTLDAMKLI